MSGVALVTGAGRGVGREVALALAQRGVRLALVGRPSTGHTQTVALLEGVAQQPPLEVHADFADAKSLEHAAARVLAELGPPSIVVHNAGLVVRASVEDTSVERWDEQMSLNLRAPFVLTRALLPSMRAAGRGRFVFVGSISGTLGSPGAAGYAASKWGLSGFMKSLAGELTDTGLMACALLPGGIDTDMIKGGPFPARMSAADVAKSIVFLALDASLAHNGAAIEMFGV